MDAVIDGLDKPSEHEQLSALHRLRVSVSEHGSLLVDNVQRLFQLLYESLLDAHGVDTSRRVAVECLRLLCEIVPTCGVDLEMRFAALLPALVSALGDERTQQYALTLLDRLLAIASTDGGASIYAALVRYGMESSDARVQKEAAVALAHLLQHADGADSANHAIDYCAMLEALAIMLSSVDDARAFAAEAALEAVQRVDPLFDEHEQQLSSHVRQLLTERLERSASYSSPLSHPIASDLSVKSDEKNKHVLLDASFTATSDDGGNADSKTQAMREARRGQERMNTQPSASSPPLTPPNTMGQAPDLMPEDVPMLPASVVRTELQHTQHQPHQQQRHHQHRGVRFADASSSPTTSDSIRAEANTAAPPDTTDSVSPPLVYGFLPLRVLEALTQGDWKVRALAIDELRALVVALLENSRASVVFGHEGKLLLLLAELLEDPNFKITISTLKTLGDVLDLLRNVLSPAEHLPLFFPTLLGRLGDSKIVIRQQCAKVLSRLMTVLGTDSVLPRFTTALEHENWHVREESLKLMMVGILRPSGAKLPLGEMQALLVDELVPLLIVDANENVRHAALEMVAVLDYVGGEALEVSATLRNASTVPSDILGHVLMRLSQPALPGVNTEGILEYGLLNRHGGKGRSANGRSLLQEADINPSVMHYGSSPQNKAALAAVLPSSSTSGTAPVPAATDGDVSDGDIALDTPFPRASSTLPPASSSRSKRDSPVRGVVHSGLAKKKIPWELESTNSQPTQMDLGVPHSPIRPTAGVSGQGGAQSAPRSASKVALWLPVSEHTSDAKPVTPPPKAGPALQTLASDPGPVRRHRSHHVHLAYEAPRSPRVPSPKHPSRRVSGVEAKGAFHLHSTTLKTPAPEPMSAVPLDVTDYSKKQWRDKQLQGQWHSDNSSSGAAQDEYIPSWHTHSSNRDGLASAAGSNTDMDATACKDLGRLPSQDRRKPSPPTVSINLHSEHPVQSSPSSSYTPKQLYHQSETESKVDARQSENFPIGDTSEYGSAAMVGGIGRTSQISLQQTQAHWPPLAASAEVRPSGQPQPIIRSRLGLLKSKQESRKRLPSRHSRSANPSANVNMTAMSGIGRGYDQTLHAPMTPLETGMYDERGERQQTLTSQSNAQSSSVHVVTAKAAIAAGDERPIRPMQSISYEEAAAWQSTSEQQQHQPPPNRRTDERPIRPMKNVSYEEAAAGQAHSDQQQQSQSHRRSQRQKARGRVSAATLRKRERQAAAASANEGVVANEIKTIHGHRPGAGSDAGAAAGGASSSGIAGRAVSQAEYLCSDELHPLDQPERALSTAFRCISQNHKEVEWFDVFDSLNHIRALAVHHPQVLCRERPVSLHDLVLAVLRQVDNLRSAIAKNALLAMSDLFRGLRNAMDSELPSVVPYLLKRASDTNGFLMESAEAALDAMSIFATPSRSLNALLSSASSKLSTTRVKTAQTIEATAAAVGSSRLAQFRELPRLLTAVARFMDDANQETRGAGKRTMVRLVREGVVSMQQLQRTLSPTDLRKVQTLLDREQRFTSSATGFVVTNAPHGGGGGANSRIASDPGVRRVGRS